jgi:KAP-like P-loop domain-containing protein
VWSDNESEIDLLGCAHLVSAVISIIDYEPLLPATIGVYGDWGSGKTTVLRMVEAELKEKPSVLLVSFNGWLFEGYEDAKTALMGTILDELGVRKGLPEKARGILQRLVGRVNWMRLFGLASKGAAAYAVGGLPALGVGAAATAAAATLAKAKDVDLDEAGKLLDDKAAEDGRRSLREFRSDFEKLIAEARIEKLVVTIDDLDRCLPETIIETLEAIKLFLFVPRTAFVIGADERLVKYAVRQRFPELPGERSEVGRDYLEKLVQFPIRIPPLGRPEMETYINLLFAKIGGLTPGQFDDLRKKAIDDCTAETLLDVRVNHGVVKAVVGSLDPKLDESLALAQRISPLLAAGMNGNPRQCKRFLNMLVMRTTMARTRKIELKQRILAKLMLLEYFAPASFKRLAEVQAEQGGKPRELAAAERAVARPPRPEPPPDLAPVAPSELKRSPPRSAPASKIVDGEDTPHDLPTWLADAWTEQWLRMEPALADEDLRPYVFFARDTLGPLGSTVQRMSPTAQQALADVLQKSEAARKNALARGKALSEADAAAVFDALCDRARHEDDLGHEESAFLRVCDWTGARLELFNQFVTFLQTLSAATIPVSVVTKVQTMAGDDPDRKRQVKVLFEVWSRGSAGPLKNAAAARLLKL